MVKITKKTKKKFLINFAIMFLWYYILSFVSCSILLSMKIINFGVLCFVMFMPIIVLLFITMLHYIDEKWKI